MDKAKPKSGKPAESMHAKTSSVLLTILACLILPYLVYFKSLHAPFILDDYPKIVENQDIHSLKDIQRRLIYPYNRAKLSNTRRNDPSRPVTYLTFALNYHFGRTNPFGYHLFNVSIHILNVLLVFLFARKLLFHTFKTDSVIAPLWIALFFGLHPANTNAVTYIFSRSDLLATFFYLGSALFFLFALERKKVFLLCGLISFMFALFSKQIAITLPAFLLLFDFIIISNFQMENVKQRKFYHIPFWVMAIAYILFRTIYFGAAGDLEARDTFERHSYFITQPYSVFRYLMMYFVPRGLTLDHFILPFGSILELKLLASLAFLLGFGVIFSVWAYRRKSGISKIILFSFVLFLVVLSPTSSFFPTTSILVENRLYLSGVGLSFLILSLYSMIFSVEFSQGIIKGKKNLLSLVLSVHIGLLGFLSWKRNEVYCDPIRLWQEAIILYPDNPKPYNNLGLLYYQQKRYDEARVCYEKAIQVKPDYSDAYGNLGLLHHVQNDYENAKHFYLKALTFNKTMANACLNLGDIFKDQRNFDMALEYYLKAIELNPNYTDACVNLGAIYGMKNNYAESEKFFQKAIEFSPNNFEAYANLGNLYYKRKKYAQALTSYQNALRGYSDNQFLLGQVRTLEKLVSSETSH